MNTLKFCENNLNGEMNQLVKRAKAEFGNVTVSVEPCLGHCDRCAASPIAVANGDLVTGNTTDLLLERVKNAIGEREAAVPTKK